MSALAMDALQRPLTLPALPPEARAWRDVAVLFAALFAVTLPVYALDERLLNGVSTWAKPLKFQASLALHFATLALVAHLLPAWRRRSPLFRGTVTVSTAAGLFEIGWIMLQAARGRASHFNDATALEAGMYALMGIGALLLVAAPFLLSLFMLRDHGARVWREPLLLGVTLGLAVSAVATLVVAGYMSTSGSHWVGEVASDAGGLPLVGWSRQGGDLRVAHFFASHALQVLPLAGLALRGGGRRGVRRLVTLSVLYLLVTGALFAQALAGLPLIGLPG